LAFLFALAGTTIARAQSPEPGECSTTQEELNANKQLLLDFFASRGMPREERSARFQTEDSVQHNPRMRRIDEITGAAGRQAILATGIRGSAASCAGAGGQK
jgi:hypothetical protein